MEDESQQNTEAREKVRNRITNETEILGLTIKKYEQISTLFSVVAFIVGLGFLTVPNYKFNPEFPLWWSDVTLVDKSVKQQEIDDFSSAWEDMCPGDENKANAVKGVEIPMQDNIITIIPATRIIEGGFRPLLMLLWIFFISAVLQASRAFDSFKFFAEKIGYNVTGGVEFSRWFEYALTSPLQIWIVGSLFFVGDIMNLMALSSAQLGLVLLGGLIEYYNYITWKKTVNNKEEKANQAALCSKILLFLAWAIHALIWIPLLLNFHYALDKESCIPESSEKNWGDAKPFIIASVWSQFTLFSFFGLLLTYRTLNPVQKETNKENSRIKYWKSRAKDCSIYAILSISAKLALDIFFLLVIGMRAPS